MDGGFVGHGPPEWQWHALRDGSNDAARWGRLIPRWRPLIPRPDAQVHRLGVIEAMQWQLDTGMPHRYVHHYVGNDHDEDDD